MLDMWVNLHFIICLHGMIGAVSGVTWPMWYSVLETGTAAALVAVLVAVLVVRLTRDLWWGGEKLPPGPVPWPVLGNLPALRGDRLHVLQDLRTQYGDVYRLYMGSTLVVFLHGQEAIREMLVTRGEDFIDRPNNFINQDILKGRGILSTSGELWKEQRRFTLHALRDFGFGKSNLESKAIEEIHNLTVCIQKTEGKPFAVDELLNSSVSNIIFSIINGQRFSHDDAKFKKFLELKDESFKAVGFTGVLMFFPWLRYIPGDPFKYHHIMSNADFLINFFTELVEEHKASMDPEHPRDFIDFYLNEIARTNLIESGSTFNEPQLVAVIGDLFMAGSETTSTSILWALLFLINYPDVQTKLRKEIHSVVGKSRLPSLDDRKNMPFVEAALLEVQRCGDIVSLGLPRAASVTSSLGGHTIPQGTTIIPVLTSLHKDPAVWRDPETFDPNRFLTADGTVIKPEHFLPFSAGRRVCLGESLAKIELFLYLTTMLQKFVFLPPEGLSSIPVEYILGATKAPKPYRLRAVLDM